MRALLDVNVLIALLDADHALHERSAAWYGVDAQYGWASCPITENGCVRVMAHPSYPNPLPVKSIVERLAEARANSTTSSGPTTSACSIRTWPIRSGSTARVRLRTFTCWHSPSAVAADS